MCLSPLTRYHTGFPTRMHDLIGARAFPGVGSAGCRPPASMDPESQETSRDLGPGPHPAAHSLRASVSSDVTGGPHCLAHLGKPKPRAAGEVGAAGALGPQDSLAGAHGALKGPQGPVWVGSERCRKNWRCQRGWIFKLSG